MSDHVEGYRLSPQQEHLWNLQREGETFHAGSAIRIEGDLDPDRLRRALESLVARHEILRTTFQRTPGVKKALQVIGGAGRLAWESGDPASRGENGREPRRFDFATGPLLAARLVPHGGAEHTLRLDLPALCADQKTLSNLFTGLVDAYAALETTSGGVEDGEAVQYLQFSEWQHEMLAEGGEAWEERTGAMRLPLGRGRGLDGEPGGAVQLTVEPGLAGRVEAVAARYGVAPEAFYLSCWKLLLARLGGAIEASVHAVVGGRSYEELEEACGLFAKALPVTVRLEDEMPFHRLLATVGRALGRAREEQDSYRPADRPLQEGELRVGFELVDLPSRRSAGGLSFTVQEQAARIERFDLGLRCARSDRGVAAALEYDARRFERREIEELAERWRALVERLAADPQTTVGAVHALTADEHRRLLVEWNDTGAEYPSDLCLHQLLARQAARTPAAPALISPAISPAGQWTFAELDARANALAHHLRALGVGPEDRAGVCLERSPEMVVAVLGILKAGAAFVPLDPGYPEERLACILEQSGPRVMLTREPLLHRLPSQAGGVVLLDRLEPAGAEAPPDSGVEPWNLAYALFTSGSTGRPKGVMIPHRGLVNYLVWAAGYYAAGEGAGSPVHSPLGFDLTLTSLLCPLLAGRPVHLMPEDGAVGGLIEALRARRGLGLVKLTPSHLEILNEAFGGEAAAGRANVLVIGGEALRAETVEPWRGPGGRATRLVNEYGPTETVVGCCVYEVGPGSPRAGVLPIGRPIANMRLYVLDSGFRPVPAGVPGEIFIAGDGLARGYLGRPDLTAERFVPDPFAAQPGGRLYRTGDLGRHLLPQADLEFLGRADTQVKIRGFRVEPGEVEAVLLEHPGVREAAVVVREDGPAGLRLVAYYVPQPERRLDPAEVRELLARRLPEYMMPAALLPLTALPLTVHGKVDRGALPAPEQVRMDRTVFTPPRTQTEILLADLWRQLLGVERVGAGDDFFQLGGHSLVAMQLVSRLRGVFGVELTVDQFFETSKLGALAAAIDAALNGGAAAGAIAAPPIRRADRVGLLPLSFSQERIWLLDRLEPGSPAYNVPAAFLLRGRLDVPAMERSMTEVVRRHEVLRTVFAQVDGRPFQTVQPPSPWSLPVADLSALAGAMRDSEVQRLSTAEARRPFDLATGPVLRTILLRLDEETQVLLATMHHAVSDGWSMEVLLGEQAALYNAFLAGEPSPLPELPIQYADYAAWQRGWLDGEVLEIQVDYWKRRLEDAPAVLALPTDRPRPAIQRYRGASRTHLLPAALRDALQGLGRAERTTLFMTLLGAFQTLLSRYSGETDLSVGAPVAGRSREEVEGLIGFFANTLVLRADLGGDPAFTEHLARVRRATLEAFAHQDVPFEKLVEELKPERDRSRPPLFQVAFTLQESLSSSAQAASAGLTGLEVTVLPLENGTSKLDLHLDLRAVEEGIGATLQYNTDLFDVATAGRLLRHFEVLAASLAESPERRLSALHLLTEEERHQLLVDWSQARPAAAADDLFPRLFEAQAAERRDAVAVAFDGRQVTYGELNARANRLARHLRGFGVGPEVLVGLCVERSPEMVLALLGILKAGAAYLPLDPSYPLERLAFMLEDAQAPVLVTQESLAGRLPSHWAFTVDLGASWDAFAGERGDDLDDLGDLDGAPLSDGPAYVIYTSGSTGRSKGVVVRHQGLANLALGMARSLGVGPESRFLQFSSLSFDASVAEATPALAVGAALHLAAREEMMPGMGMVRRLQELEVTHAILPPSVLAALPAEPLPALSTLTVAGEACPGELAAAWSAGRRFVDAYGPTEVTVCASLADYAGAGKPSIGHPFPGLCTHVLDRHLQPVPAGVPGELFVGGVGVARGYLNRPELTAARFVPDPFGGTPGGRLYRTGDLVRWLPDGDLDFLGRIDHQVKVRGFRIEPGEIEAVLGDHPAVRETVVVVREDLPGDRRLTAYLAVEPGCEPAAEELRGFVAERLPEFMVPADFILLAAMPLSPNGKVDRAALPAPDRARRAAGDAFVAPRDPVEELLAQVWSEVLGVERVGVHDDFFELGGHSLAATQVLDRTRGLLGVEVSMGAFFGQPTVAGLAMAVDNEQGQPRDPILPVSRDGDLPLSFAQELMWTAERRGDAAWLHNVPMAYWVRGPLEIAALAASLDEVARRHEVLRTAFPAVDGLPVQRVRSLDGGRLPVVDLQALDRSRGRAEARRLAELEARRPFDLERGPVWRSLLLRLDELEHLLALTFHHIVIDPPSGEILQRELATLYTACTERRPSPLPPLGLQYGDYAVWQRRSLDSEALAGQLAYWRERLAGARAVELQVPRARPAGRVARSASHLLRLGPQATAACHRLGRRLGTTLSMTVLAAFKGLLAGLSGQRDILVRTPVVNRRPAEVEPLIGFFPNALLLRTDLAGDPSFAELAGRVRETVLGAYAHQDVPFDVVTGALLPELGLPGDLARVTFNFYGTSSPAPALGGLELEPAGIEPGLTDSDLVLVLQEGADGLDCRFNYRQDLFAPAAVRDLAEGLNLLLERVAADPEERLSRLAPETVETGR